jgi:hypothetical protein
MLRSVAAGSDRPVTFWATVRLVVMRLDHGSARSIAVKFSLGTPSVAFAKATRHNFFTRCQSAVYHSPSKSHVIINATKDNRDFDFVDDMESER